MAVEDTIVSRLLAISAVTALVSTRVYLDKLPQSPTYPVLRVQLVSDLDEYHLRGGGFYRARVQVDAYAKELSGINPYALASAVAEAAHGDDAGSGLSGWQGAVGSPSVTVQACLRVDRRRYYDPDELRVVTVSQDYQVIYRA